MSDLQELVNGRLGRAGPWQRLVEAWMAEGDSANVAAMKLAQAAKLPLGRLSGQTLRRWLAETDQADQADQAVAS